MNSPHPPPFVGSAQPAQAASPAVKDLKEAGEVLLECWKGMGGNEDALRNGGGSDVSRWLGVSEVESGFIEKLDWKKQGLTGAVPEAVGRLVTLKYLGLNGNDISSVPASLGQLISLKELWLGYNRIAAIPSALSHLSSLTGLGLHGNLLTNLPPTLGQLSSLELLYLSSNPLTSVPEDIGELKALTQLYLPKQTEGGIPAKVMALKVTPVFE